jgi:hypothetical protein
VLPANVRIDWKVIDRYKHSSLFGLVISNEGKKFYNIETWCSELINGSFSGQPTTKMMTCKKLS